MEKPNHIRFNRLEIFKEEDRFLVLDAIHESKTKNDSRLQNMLFGLFDGYLYNELQDRIKNLRAETCQKLETLITKIKNHVKA